MLSSSANVTVLGWQEQGQRFRVNDWLINAGKMNVAFLLEKGQCFNCCSFIHLNKNKSSLEIRYSAAQNYIVIIWLIVVHVYEQVYRFLYICF